MRQHFDGVHEAPDALTWPLDPQEIDTDAGAAVALGAADGDEADEEPHRLRCID